MTFGSPRLGAGSNWRLNIQREIVNITFEFVEKMKMHVQSFIQVLVYFHDCCLISTTVAVVWCAEYRDSIVLMRPIVTIHNLDREYVNYLKLDIF